MKKYLLIIAAVLFFASPSAAADRINPASDLTYLGAFKVPWSQSDTCHGAATSWGYAEMGMTFYPSGDSGSGSLYSIGHVYQDCVSEFTLATPVISTSKNHSELNTATTLQGFLDVTGTYDLYTPDPGTAVDIGDIQYLAKQGSQTTDKLYWLRYVYYIAPADYTTIGWSELTIGDSAAGIWEVGAYHSHATSKYLLEIESSWADTYASSRYLGSGRFRLQGGSWGPTLYATAPWADGNPPADAAALTATQLLYYPDENNRVNDFSHADVWADAAWINVGSKAAYIVAGTNGRRTKSGVEYYGPPGPDGCGGQGYHAEPYFGTILFYDIDDLAAVSLGTQESYEPQPYAQYQFAKYQFLIPPSDAVDDDNCFRSQIGGLGYDSTTNKLYVMEYYIGGERKPIVHVFQIVDAAGTADTTPPTEPSNIQKTVISASQNDISWDASSDAGGGVLYIVSVNGLPIGVTTDTDWSHMNADDYVSPVYAVEAIDSVGNSTKDVYYVTQAGGGGGGGGGGCFIDTAAYGFLMAQ